MFSQTAIAAVLLTLAPSALAVGSARVVNNCGSAVYFANVAQNVADGMSELPSSGFSQPYSLPGVGISIKLSQTDSLQGVTQFEYTWADGNINYDISNIDGSFPGGMSLVPSMAGASGYPTCQPVECPAGEGTCAAAYNAPNDVRTMVCPDASDLTMILCPSGSSSSSSNATKRSLTHGHRVHSRQFR